MLSAMSSWSLAPIRPAFRAMGAVLCPRAADLDDEGWAAAEAMVERMVGDRPPAVRRQLRLFVVLAGTVLPLVRYGRTFRGLDPERQRRWLRSLERSRILLLRRGLWGLRTLAFMGVYGLDEVRDEIGYRAHRDGWAARGDETRP